MGVRRGTNCQWLPAVLEDASVRDRDDRRRLAGLRALAFDRLDESLPLKHLPEDDVLAVQPRRLWRKQQAQTQRTREGARREGGRPALALVLTAATVMKNWDPLELGPAFAIDSRYGTVCLT